MIMTTRPDQGEGRDALRKQLSDFIEVLNNVLPADVTEVISIEGDTISCDDWAGDALNGYILTDKAQEEPVRTEWGTLAQVEVNDRRQLIDLCTDILKRSLSEKIAWARYSVYMVELEEYTLRFAKKLRDEWGCFSGVSMHCLPVKITACDTMTENGETSFTTSGFYDGNMIAILSADPEHRERDEQASRHETIHYMLAKAGFDASDDSALFWFFATIYDARPYAEMNEEQSALFNALNIMYQMGRKDEIDEAIRQAREEAGKNPNKTILQ